LDSSTSERSQITLTRIMACADMSQPSQQASKQLRDLVNDTTSCWLDNENSGIDESITSNSSRSGMLVSNILSDARLNAATESARLDKEGCAGEQAFQTTYHTWGDMVMKSTHFPPQGIDQLPPLPKKLMKAPNAVPQLPALDDDVTTLIIRSIPPKTSQESLIALWPPTWGYNFLYLPHSPKQRRSVAYAFINFVSNEAAKLFYDSWEGKVFTARGHTKALSIHAAQIQGVWSNLKHLQKQGISQLKNDKHLPALFDGDVCISFRGVLREMEIMEECSTAT